MRPNVFLGVVVLLSAGCSHKNPIDAMGACHALERSGVAANCRPEEGGGLGAAARDRAQFDLPSVAGEHGSVFHFRTEEDFRQAEESYRKAAMLAGPHRYGNAKALIFTQFNKGASAEVGDKAKATIDDL